MNETTTSDSPEFSPFDPASLPPTVVRYLEAQRGPEGRAAVGDAFSADAHVRDEGIDHDGRDAIREWLSTAASEYTYTTTFTGQRHERPDRWVIAARLEGDFPGGVADLRFVFTVRSDLIADLVIAP